MSTIKNIVGQRFGLLVVLKPRGVDRHSKMRWLCACDCGNTSIAIGCDLRSGKTNSCGCRAGKRTHGLSGSWVYQCWWNMRSRCYNPNHPEYHLWGGRGIKMCDRWLNSVVDFHADILASIGDRPPAMSLDRRDNDGNYEPDNVRWATPAQQTANQRRVSKPPKAPFLRLPSGASRS
jgi:hypothetical protein